MRTQRRWRCADCRREWAYAHNWNERNCPACGSKLIERVEFQGMYDIDTPLSMTPKDDKPAPALPVPGLLGIDAPPVTLVAGELRRLTEQIAAIHAAVVLPGDNEDRLAGRFE